MKTFRDETEKKKHADFEEKQWRKKCDNKRDVVLTFLCEECVKVKVEGYKVCENNVKTVKA